MFSISVTRLHHRLDGMKTETNRKERRGRERETRKDKTKTRKRRKEKKKLYYLSCLVMRRLKLSATEEDLQTK
jgi:hypothetical protein